MFTIQENIPLRPKTTLKIGGKARYYAELSSKDDVEEAVKFSKENKVPLIILGGGSNTLFADGTIDALVVKVVADDVKLGPLSGNTTSWITGIVVQAGKNLANLINEFAKEHLDLSPLTGIPGTVGGAIVGNAGQGFSGTWIDRFVESVEVFVDGEWKTFSNDECGFAYRTSAFKHMNTPLIFSATLNVPSKPQKEIEAEVEHLLQKRIETQPHVKTAGSVFLSLSKEEPAWKLIDRAGLRGYQIGDLSVSDKHANFFINEGSATFKDAKKLVEHIRNTVPEDLKVEMRFIEENGSTIEIF